MENILIESKLLETENSFYNDIFVYNSSWLFEREIWIEKDRCKV